MHCSRRPTSASYCNQAFTLKFRVAIDSINQQAAAIHTLKATVDIDSAAGGIKKGTQTQYKEIRGFVLARKPGDLHMQGLMPFVRTLAFDMVSDGQDFKLWIPVKNKFVIGQNQVTVPNSEPMETSGHRISTRPC